MPEGSQPVGSRAGTPSQARYSPCSLRASGLGFQVWASLCETPGRTLHRPPQQLGHGVWAGCPRGWAPLASECPPSAPQTEPPHSASGPPRSVGNPSSVAEPKPGMQPEGRATSPSRQALASAGRISPTSVLAANIVVAKIIGCKAASPKRDNITTNKRGPLRGLECHVNNMSKSIKTAWAPQGAGTALPRWRGWCPSSCLRPTGNVGSALHQCDVFLNEMPKMSAAKMPQ